MKRIYVKPEVETVVELQQESILAGTIETGRRTAGGPASDTPSISTSIKETDSYTDAFGGRGQGVGGFGTRSKVWDDEVEDD